MPILAAAIELRQKEKKERLTYEVSMFSLVCKPFILFLLISRQSLVSVAGCPNACGWQWQGFRVEYAQTRLRKIPPETALLPDLASAVKATRYLCIRASGTGG
jgi:hypothetical protein